METLNWGFINFWHLANSLRHNYILGFLREAFKKKGKTYGIFPMLERVFWMLHAISTMKPQMNFNIENSMFLFLESLPCLSKIWICNSWWNPRLERNLNFFLILMRTIHVFKLEFRSTLNSNQYCNTNTILTDLTESRSHFSETVCSTFIL